MTVEARLLEESAEELFEDAPCGYLSTRLDGTIVKVNRTFERWLVRAREDLLDRVRFQDLLTAGGRIYYETHYSPLLQMQGTVQEIAIELVRADGTRLPALINSVLRREDTGRPGVIRTTVFDATDRRRYEQELLRATEREHEVARSLQRSLLSGELPSSPALELEVFYGPTAPGLEVGGDWYDAFWLEEQHTVALVVGDVVGRGLAAAAVMGQLRSAVRALASLDLTPGRLLDALEAYSRRHQVGAMTTLTYAELNLDTAVMRFACAGHPPPLLAIPEEQARFAWQARSMPINAYRQPNGRPDYALGLTPGTTIALYTDGLVEHRCRDAAEGMDQLSPRGGQTRRSTAERNARLGCEGAPPARRVRRPLPNARASEVLLRSCQPVGTTRAAAPVTSIGCLIECLMEYRVRPKLVESNWPSGF